VEIKTFDISGPLLLTPKLFKDNRGYFYESFREDKFNDAVGEIVKFVQDNQSYSIASGTVRGLHYQAHPHAQGKLVRCLAGSIIDIIVDVRQGSATFGQHLSILLTGEDHHQLYVPVGFLHGFSTHAEETVVSYKVTDYYSPAEEGSVFWNSPTLGIDWGVSKSEVILSEKDTCAPIFKDWKSPFNI